MNNNDLSVVKQQLSMFYDKSSALVVDNVFALYKAGFAGDDSPRSAFPSTVGWPHRHNKSFMAG